MKDIFEKYTKAINPDNYMTIELMGNSGKRGNMVLSKEDFLSGKNGLVFVNNETGKLTFSNERNKEVHLENN